MVLHLNHKHLCAYKQTDMNVCKLFMLSSMFCHASSLKKQRKNSISYYLPWPQHVQFFSLEQLIQPLGHFSQLPSFFMYWSGMDERHFSGGFRGSFSNSTRQSLAYTFILKLGIQKLNLVHSGITSNKLIFAKGR